MPIMDAQLLLCESMSIAAAAGASTKSTNVIYIPPGVDHQGAAVDDRYNVSQRLNLNIVVEDEDLLAAVDGSVVTFELFNDDSATPVDLGVAIATHALTENTPTEHPDGTQICSIPLPVGQLEAYFELKVSIATQDLSTGKITAWIGGPIQQGGNP